MIRSFQDVKKRNRQKYVLQDQLRVEVGKGLQPPLVGRTLHGNEAILTDSEKLVKGDQRLRSAWHVGAAAFLWCRTPLPFV